MPLYEYECDNCGHRAEVIQRVGAPPIGPCDECGGKMKRLLSAPAFQFKGTGWYVTDYAKKSESGSTSNGEPRRDKSAGKASEAPKKSSESPKKKESSDSSSKKAE